MWFEWEKPMIVDFMTSIAQVSLHSDKEDSWLWNDLSSDNFSVKSAYSKLAHNGNGNTNGRFADL